MRRGGGGGGEGEESREKEERRRERRGKRRRERRKTEGDDGRKEARGGKRRRKGKSEGPESFELTGVVHVQFVHYPLVASTKHHDELLDGHGAVAVAGSGDWTRPAHHSLPAGLQEHRWRVGGRHGRSHSSGKGRSGKKSPSGNGALQQLSHTPFRLRQLSRRSGFSHSSARLHGGRHLNYPPSLRFFPLFSFTLSPQESPETVERLSPRGWRPSSPAALTTCPGAPAYELEREALGAAILSRLSLLPSSVVALPRRKWRSPGPVPTPPKSPALAGFRGGWKGATSAAVVPAPPALRPQLWEPPS